MNGFCKIEEKKVNKFLPPLTKSRNGSSSNGVGVGVGVGVGAVQVQII